MMNTIKKEKSIQDKLRSYRGPCWIVVQNKKVVDYASAYLSQRFLEDELAPGDRYEAIRDEQGLRVKNDTGEYVDYDVFFTTK